MLNIKEECKIFSYLPKCINIEKTGVGFNRKHSKMASTATSLNCFVLLIFNFLFTFKLLTSKLDITEDL